MGSVEQSFVDLSQTSGVRINGTNLQPNGGMLADVSTPLFYWSIVNESATDFYRKTECPGLYTAFRLLNTGPSLFSDALLSLQYQIEETSPQSSYSQSDRSPGLTDKDKKIQPNRQLQSDLKKQADLQPQRKTKTQTEPQKQTQPKSQTGSGPQAVLQAQSGQKTETSPQPQNDRRMQPDPSPVFGYVPTTWGESSDYRIYENKYALPLGYTYSQSVSEAQAENSMAWKNRC